MHASPNDQLVTGNVARNPKYTAHVNTRQLLNKWDLLSMYIKSKHKALQDNLDFIFKYFI